MRRRRHAFRMHYKHGVCARSVRQLQAANFSLQHVYERRRRSADTPPQRGRQPGHTSLLCLETENTSLWLIHHLGDAASFTNGTQHRPTTTAPACPTELLPAWPARRGNRVECVQHRFASRKNEDHLRNGRAANASRRCQVEGSENQRRKGKQRAAAQQNDHLGIPSASVALYTLTCARIGS